MLNIIFSKDRACQLELLLRSIKDHHKDYQEDIFVCLCKASDSSYLEGYKKILSYHSDKQFILVNESNFRNDLLNILKSFQSEYLTFFTDDDVFINDFTYNSTPFKMFEKYTNIICLSLRLSPFINYCYTQKRNAPQPPFQEHNNARIWNWKELKIDTDWNYPMSVDGHIFRTNEIINKILNGNYKAPNSFEGYLSGVPNDAPEMVCFDKSIIVNVPANRVNTEAANHSGEKYYFSSLELNNKFLQGFRIKTDNIYGIIPNAPHFELGYQFQKT
jgi:hypothetical protein